MEKFKTLSDEYKILKKHYKLIPKKEWDLDSINFRKTAGFKNFVSHKSIVEFILGLDDCLKNTYDGYQNILRAVRDKSVNLLEKEVFDKSDRNIFDGMKKSLRTLKGYFEYIKNAVEQPYSNGFIEAVNNKIKVIKRTAYGYRSFYNLRNRVLIVNNLVQYKIIPGN